MNKKIDIPGWNWNPTIVILAVLVAIGLVLGILYAAYQADQPEARSVRERISIDARDDAYMYYGADLYIYSDDHSTQKFHVDGATGNTTVAGTISVADSSTFAGETIYTSSVITPTAGEIITPTATFYTVNSSGAVSMTLAASGTAGQMLFLYGDDNNTVTINDTNVKTTTGSALSVGQYDIAVFIYNGAAWVEWLLAADS